ncbi:hypothetical protein J2S13_001417 [Oikeobacillus pervagus]|uniref:Uncharacterized protein n=1 Tax=Oikeobacillus pervagus TaxID=1325931 RepID=A0AAJ1SYA5_9BACI|nr:hypothetical protein [Oikeobacillus pervagus]MDQ0215018.1 hypothetical protein [Oikeobacillus pervagus]
MLVASDQSPSLFVESSCGSLLLEVKSQSPTEGKVILLSELAFCLSQQSSRLRFLFNPAAAPRGSRSNAHPFCGKVRHAKAGHLLVAPEQSPPLFIFVTKKIEFISQKFSFTWYH